MSTHQSAVGRAFDRAFEPEQLRLWAAAYVVVMVGLFISPINGVFRALQAWLESHNTNEYLLAVLLMVAMVATICVLKKLFEILWWIGTAVIAVCLITWGSLSGETGDD